ncbi:MAG: VWA domain-containing protein [Nitrospiraceae bacterium]|nr:VWA domain-containing protein [Nitrospiraceae bacterium]
MNNKLACCFIIPFVSFLSLIFHTPALASDAGVRAPFENRPLYVVFLVDSSGSMKKTDPDEIRKLASQAVVTLLSPEDKIAVVEFDSDARLLSGWRSPSEKEPLFSAIGRLGNDGNFTDFRVGLAKAGTLFNGVAESSRKVILLLSDGVFDPDPYSEKYAPYNLEYRIETRGRSKAEIARINEEYKGKLTPVAKRIVEGEILPDLKSKGIEIYTVGFSPYADKSFLNYLADETSASRTESHYFYANNAVDLMDTFVGILHFWANKITLRTEDGEIVQGTRNMIALDSFLKDVSLIILTGREADITVKAEGNYSAEDMLRDIHPKLKIFNLSQKPPPGEWMYSFNSGSGKYRLLLTGKSTLDLAVSGLKEKYAYGEPIRAHVDLTYNNQDARSYLSSASRVAVEVSEDDSKSSPVDLKEDKDGFAMEYVAKRPGILRLKFTFFAKDKQNKDLLPRPSKEYRLEILPRFYVEPDIVKFGDVVLGKTSIHNVKVFSGLPETIHVRMSSVVSDASRCKNTVEMLPAVKGDEFVLGTGQSLDRKLTLIVPKKGCWGDFSGDIVFTTDRGDVAKVRYSVHVPSIWEKLTCFVLFSMIFLALALIALSIFWGYLKAPVGALRRISSPPTAPLLHDIKLGRVKKGIWNRWLHWKKNVIKIASDRSDIKLAGLSQDMKADLIFHRFGGDYIRNMSPKNSGNIVIVRHPDVGIEIERYPGASYQLSHGLYLKIGEYEFIYERMK